MTQTTKNLPNLRLLVLDVDGTLTDGSIIEGSVENSVCFLAYRYLAQVSSAISTEIAFFLHLF